jgi:hypothetical protein
MKVDGACHCGEITVTAEVEPSALPWLPDFQPIPGSTQQQSLPVVQEHSS